MSKRASFRPLALSPLLVAMVLASACFNPDYGDTAFLCDEGEGGCPEVQLRSGGQGRPGDLP